jgi:hypothetical protein
VFLVALAVLAWRAWRTDPASPAADPARVVARPTGGWVSALAPGDSPAARTFVSLATEIHDQCELDLQFACDGSACAAMMVAPDMDQLGGWLQLAWRSPRFVLSTVARDLGVPASGMPCGSAVGGLLGERGVAAVELADGTELWCAIDGQEDAGYGWCRDEAARRLGVDVRFDGPSVRRLVFDRSGG